MISVQRLNRIPYMNYGDKSVVHGTIKQIIVGVRFRKRII